MLGAVSKNALVRLMLAFLIAVGLVAVATPARAADASSVIDTSSIKIANLDKPGQPLSQYQSAQVDFNFTTQGKTNADGQPILPGDTFSLTLPEVFSVASASWDVKSDDGSETIATCQLSAATREVVCTFTEAIRARAYVSGSMFVRAQAVATTSTRTVPIGTVNGEIQVPLPGDGPIGPSEGPGYPTALDKWGWFSNDERTRMYWAIFMPGDKLAAGQDVVVTDTIGAGHKYDPTGGVVVMSTSNPTSSADWVEVPASAVATIPAADGKSFQVTIDQSAIDTTRLYRVEYYTTADEGTNYTGYPYANTANINGEDVMVSFKREIIGGGKADGPGFGGIGVTKAIEGDAAAQVPTDTVFTVTATYTVDGAAQTKQLEVTAGGPAGELHGLPIGTKVTLSEGPLPLVDRVEWGAPTFTNTVSTDGVVISADGTSAEITVADQQTIAVQLTNVASPVTTPPATPPAPTTTTEAPGPVIATPPAPVVSSPMTTTKPMLANTGVEAGGLGGIVIALICAGLLATFGSRVRVRR